MKRKSVDLLGSLQRKVMEAIWDLGEASVHSVVERFSRGNKPAYTTILTVMQNLEKGGRLTHRQEGRSYIYRPILSRDDVAWRSIRQSVRNLFQGIVPSGTHDLRWDGSDESGKPVASGVYLYSLVVGSELSVRRMLLLR